MKEKTMPFPENITQEKYDAFAEARRVVSRDLHDLHFAVSMCPASLLKETIAGVRAKSQTIGGGGERITVDLTDLVAALDALYGAGDKETPAPFQHGLLTRLGLGSARGAK